ncbi:class I SAM-dependent methyltransferase [Rhodopseudomonas sp. P2A-2r]|uniref:methyltransferase domain-containing protein n=1 Tax=Rhodopseudomonas sp. P2A-2r TaxID=2991972 RepID=UPI002234AE28|nr:class I SAM-dependent methyltransferase [Rhodopseudomonas sp. P2A-2r]UZE51921.1 class I SAM-dependent methyltransferase [Rhodopseudomonas sp. P2A-2r]
MKFRLPRDFDPAAYLTLNPDVKRSGKSAKIHYLRHGHAEGRAFRYTSEHRGVSEAARARKMDRLAPFLRTDMPFERLGLKLDFLSDELRQQTRIAETDNISANGYDGTVNALIEKHSAGLILDCGAGKRPIYHENVVNYEIVDYDSTDVIGVGEALPFADASFDAVISVAVLEHVRDPFKCAKEIIRVLKPGGDLYCCIPFLQPLHGYPHHYFNATPQGIRSLFEEALGSIEVSVPLSTHPIWSLSWILRTWRNNLPLVARMSFDRMKVSDLLANPTNYLNKPFCTGLSQAAQLEIASATVLTGIKTAK